MKINIKKISFLTALIILSVPINVLAQSSSTNYRVEESTFGVGGELDASSPNYRSKQSAGETTIGNTSSANYQANAGFNTTDQPMLEFEVTSGNIDLGVLNTASTATANGTFSIRTYLSGGYVVTAVNDPPKNESGVALNSLTSPTASSAGAEQFGINLVANTSPTTFGSNPSQSPDSTFGFGFASSGYNTANLYKYVKGDKIAESATSSGKTIFTVSYIFNVSALTKAGNYNTDQTFVVTSTF